MCYLCIFQTMRLKIETHTAVKIRGTVFSIHAIENWHLLGNVILKFL